MMSTMPISSRFVKFWNDASMTGRAVSGFTTKKFEEFAVRWPTPASKKPVTVSWR